MTKALTNPLQAIVAKAATALPATTGRVAPYAERQRRLETGRGTVVLADVSGSMEETAWGGRTKHALLREALANALQDGHEVIAFSATAVRVPAIEELPPAHGNTALHAGLRAATSHTPARILVISDGQPDDEGSALAEAQAFPGVIDVLYIGPDGNRQAIDFLRRLAKGACGTYQTCDVGRPGAPKLTHEVRRVLMIEGPRS